MKALDDVLLESCETEEVGTYSGPEETLLVSAIKWGFYLLRAGKIIRLEKEHVTGVWLEPGCLYWSMQSDDHLKVVRLTADGEKTFIVSTEACDIHDIRMVDGELVAVSTSTNEVVSVSEKGIVTRRWKFPGHADAWHLNCLDVWDGRLVVSAFGEYAWHREWKGNWAERGIVVDVASGEVLWSGLSQPHTPRMLPDGRRAVCDFRSQGVSINGKGELKNLSFPGTMPRGLAVSERHLFVGLSQNRNLKDNPKTAAIAQIDLETLETVREIALPAVEIYDIVVLSRT